MRRREFILLLTAVMTTKPRATRAQKPDRVRRIGALLPFAAGDAEGLHRAKIFTQELHRLGWADGRNAQIDYRWPDGDIKQIQALAEELAGSGPDVLFVVGTAQVAALAQATRIIPIVFIVGSDPVVQGIVRSLPRPGGNATGFFAFELSMGGKWVELLNEIVPGLRRVAFIYNPETAPAGISFLHSVKRAAALLSVEAVEAPIRDTADIERAAQSVAREPGGGLIVAPDPFTLSYRKQMIELAAQYRLPTIYSVPDFATDGGLLSYGLDPLDLYRRAGSYVDRILRGANPADLPVHEPAKFELVINLKTAKALGLTIPPSLLARADEVIE